MTVINLQNYNAALKNIYLVIGRGITSNIYIINGKNITIVDSGNGAKENSILPKLKEIFIQIPKVSKIILTHFHFDHIGGLTELLEAFKTEIIVQKEEKALLARARYEGKINEIVDGDKIMTGDYILEVLHTPGHSPGSICLYERKNRFLISGDTVFPNGAFGRCDLPLGNHKALVQSLKRLTEIGIDTMLPGHGIPVFSDANQQIELSFRRAKSYF